MKCHLSVSDDPELRIVCGAKLVTPEVGVAYESDFRMLRDVLELLGPNKCSKCVKKWESEKLVDGNKNGEAAWKLCFVMDVVGKSSTHLGFRGTGTTSAIGGALSITTRTGLKD